MDELLPGTSTIQHYGTSENTVESFRLTEAMGADAVEIDVRLPGGRAAQGS